MGLEENDILPRIRGIIVLAVTNETTSIKHRLYNLIKASSLPGGKDQIDGLKEQVTEICEEHVQYMEAVAESLIKSFIADPSTSSLRDVAYKIWESYNGLTSMEGESIGWKLNALTKFLFQDIDQRNYWFARYETILWDFRRVYGEKLWDLFELETEWKNWEIENNEAI